MSSFAMLKRVCHYLPALIAAFAGWAGLVLGGDEKGPVKAAPPAAMTDDPLPTGCTLRFGTSRYRHGTAIMNLAVSPDGKRALAASGNRWLGSVRAFDLTTGRALYTLDKAGTFYEAVAFSPDGRKLATKKSHTVFIHDADTGKELQQIKLPSANPSTLLDWIAFTPDGKGVAVADAKGQGIHLIDLEKEAVVRTFLHQMEGNVVFAGAFSPDGKLLAGGGYDNEDGVYFVRLWEVTTGKELRRFNTGKGGTRCLAFSADGTLLATGDDSARPKALLRLFDVATAKERGQVALPDGTSIRSVAFAPDGETVAAAGGTSTRLFDTATLKERLHVGSQAIGLRFSADGKVLTGAVAGAIYRWDPVTGKPLTPASAGDSPVAQILVTPDGRRLVTRGQDGDGHLWDARTGAYLRRLNVAWQRGIALSPDGRFLVWPVEDENAKFPDPENPSWIHTGNRVRLYDLADDKFSDRFPAFKGDAHDLAFTPDGKNLLTVDHGDGTVRVWDVATGKEQRTFRAVRKDETTKSHYVWHAVLSPDGRTLAVTYQGVLNTTGLYNVRLWDVGTGKELHELSGHENTVEGMAFSPDSRLLVTESQAARQVAFLRDVRPRLANQVYVWDVATGERVAPLPDGLEAGAATAAAFAPDGRTLATAAADGTIQVWEVATWSVRAEFHGHRDRVCSLTFANDGRLFSGGLDTTVLAWNVRPPRPAAGPPTGKEWDDLAAAKAEPALAAQGRLLADPAAVVTLFSEKIKPVEAVEAKRLAQLVADLDSADFDTRDQATRTLRDLGSRAMAAVREAAEKADSAEVRRRANGLLDEWNKQSIPPEELRALRAVEVLEWVNTVEARQLLGVWAKGATGARLTREAQATLERLATKRSP